MGQVRLILREDVPKLGEAGEVVSVKPGYARNFLLAEGKAMVATEAKVKEFEHNKRVIAEQQSKLMKDLQSVRDKIQSLVLEVTAQAGDEGKLFGSVTAQRIGELLAEKGVEIDRRKIALGEPIKALGEYDIDIKLHREVSAQVHVTVVAQEG